MKVKLLTLFAISISLSLFLYFYGEAGIVWHSNPLLEIRIPKIFACLFGGGLLALSGMLMQILFQNPLAGPDILGISAGASLFAAIGIILRPFLNETLQSFSIGMFSFLGALIFLLLILFFIYKNVSKTSLLIIGILLSAFTSSVITLIINTGTASGLKNYLSWSMGTFRNLTYEELPLFVFFSFISFLPILFLKRPLSQILLSDQYAQSMGLNIKKLKFQIVLLISMQVAIVTYYCGPIGFIGIMAHHLAKLYFKSIKFYFLIPGTFLIGSILALIVEGVLTTFYQIPFTVNSVLGFIGAPIITYLLIRKNSWGMR